MALAKSEGAELTDEQLEAVAGGSWNSCTKDGCTNFNFTCPMN